MAEKIGSRYYVSERMYERMTFLTTLSLLFHSSVNNDETYSVGHVEISHMYIKQNYVSWTTFISLAYPKFPSSVLSSMDL